MKLERPCPSLSRRLKQLDEELLNLGEEATLLEELDGFIAGLLVCPDLIKPGEWLPVIWNLDGGDLQPAFDDLGHANQIFGLIMEHYNSVARTLMEHPDRYTPLFSVYNGNGDILWELLDRGLRESRQVAAGSLAKTPQCRRRNGGRDARSADTRRRRLRRSIHAAKGRRQNQRDGPRQYRALDSCSE